jgi:hypothetical protein
MLVDFNSGWAAPLEIWRTVTCKVAEGRFLVYIRCTKLGSLRGMAGWEKEFINASCPHHF